MDTNTMKSGTVAIIPARGGSKGVPRKNVRLLGRMPVIAHTILAAKESKNIDRVFVSTEDEEIRGVAIDYGAEVLKRPECLAGDEVQLTEVVLYAFRQIEHEVGLSPRTVVMLQPTSPFRTSKHIDEAFLCYTGNGTTFAAYRNYKFHWNDRDGSDVDEPVFHNPARRLGRQWTSEWLCEENGAIYIFPAQRLSLELSFRLSPFSVYVMPERDGFEIDTEDDWELAVLRSHNGNA